MTKKKCTLLLIVSGIMPRLLHLIIKCLLELQKNNSIMQSPSFAVAHGILREGIHLSTKVDLESNPYGSQNDILANLGEWANSKNIGYKVQSGKHLKETKYQPLKMQLWDYR
ncbi:hypothetical protein J1N35_031344 [Gossypium stocksii]|uniref:Uncharacterized protein n=1 Tax=Gossypium stocksii TaxID=47602 RepID=A0A9D3V2F4_9ROSI|nr:hypothetical protein J1N35_031344 [Gossypium stocksii]